MIVLALLVLILNLFSKTVSKYWRILVIGFTHYPYNYKSHGSTIILSKNFYLFLLNWTGNSPNYKNCGVHNY